MPFRNLVSTFLNLDFKKVPIVEFALLLKPNVDAVTSLACLKKRLYLYQGWPPKMSAKYQIVTLLSYYCVLPTHWPNSVRNCNLMLNGAMKRGVFLADYKVKAGKQSPWCCSEAGVFVCPCLFSSV